MCHQTWGSRKKMQRTRLIADLFWFRQLYVGMAELSGIRKIGVMLHDRTSATELGLSGMKEKVGLNSWKVNYPQTILSLRLLPLFCGGLVVCENDESVLFIALIHHFFLYTLITFLSPLLLSETLKVSTLLTQHSLIQLLWSILWNYMFSFCRT